MSYVRKNKLDFFIQSISKTVCVNFFLFNIMFVVVFSPTNHTATSTAAVAASKPKRIDFFGLRCVYDLCTDVCCWFE